MSARIVSDQPHWLSTFWFEALRSTYPRAQPALLRMNERHALSRTPIQWTKKFTGNIRKTRLGGNVGRLMCGLGSIAGLAMAEFKDIELKDRTRTALHHEYHSPDISGRLSSAV